MSLFKCKMCGGDLEIADGARVAVCQYCGTTQTIPKLDSSKAENLYDRAGHFRRSNEFDKAEAIYERLLEEDKTDSECYWSLVLCRYGVEYVEDPTTHKRIPTVNRTQYTSVFDDDNYKLAIKYASPEQKAVYEAEAKAREKDEEDMDCSFRRHRDGDSSHSRGGLIYKNYYLPLGTYKEAVKLMDNGELLKARIKFMTISDFKDSRELADESLYRIAEQLIEQGDTASAMVRMEQLGDYKNAYEYRYKYAMDLAAEGNTDGAIEQLQKISSYKDAAEQIKAIRYQQGLQHMKAKEYSAAKTIFESLGDYQDSAAKVQEVVDLDKKRQNWIYKKYIENFDFYDVSEDDIIKQGKALDTVTDDEIWSKIGDSISKFTDMGYVIVLTNKAQSLAQETKSENAGCTIDGMYYCDNIESARNLYSNSYWLPEILQQNKRYTWMTAVDVSLPAETADNISSHGSKAIICKYTKADESGWTTYRYEGYEVKARIENKAIVYDVTKYVEGAETTRSGLSIYELLNY